MSIDKLAVLDGDKCILQLLGVRTFRSNKYDITKHPSYKHLSIRLRPQPDEIYEVYHLDFSNQPEADE